MCMCMCMCVSSWFVLGFLGMGVVVGCVCFVFVSCLFLCGGVQSCACDSKDRDRQGYRKEKKKKEKEKEKRRRRQEKRTVLIQWIAWCMAVLSWWSHLFCLISSLCVQKEKMKEKIKEKREKRGKKRERDM